MSIIQEALKKVERKVAPEAGLPQKVAGPRQTEITPQHKATPFGIKPVILAVFIIVVIFTVWQFSLGDRAKSKNAAKADSVATAPHQEITYKPIVEKKAEPAEVRTDVVANLKKQEPKFILNGIMYLEDGPQAIINDALVREGDIVNSAKVARINRNSVVLNLDDVEMTLILKK